MDSEHKDLLEAALKAVTEVQSKSAGNAGASAGADLGDFNLQLSPENSERIWADAAAAMSLPSDPIQLGPIGVSDGAAPNPADVQAQIEARTREMHAQIEAQAQALKAKLEAQALAQTQALQAQMAAQAQQAQAANDVKMERIKILEEDLKQCRQELEESRDELKRYREELATAREALQKAETENGQLRVFNEHIQKSADQVRAAQKQATEKCARLSEDFDNYRKRVARDQAQMKNQAEERTVLGFLGVMDNFERAIAHARQSSDFEQLMQGVELTSKLYLAALAKLGCTPYNSLGAVCDPVYHDVLQRVIDPSVPHNTVVQEHLRGYIMHDRVIRPALVVVAQHEDGDVIQQTPDMEEVEEAVAADPTPMDSPVVEPAPVEEIPAVEPAPVEEIPAEPAPVEPAPVEPAPVEPAPVEPAPVEPAPVQFAAPETAPVLEMPSFEIPDVPEVAPMLDSFAAMDEMGDETEMKENL